MNQSLTLTALGNNGGPTLTHGLHGGSPALNAGVNPAGLTTDQRGAGYVRVSGVGTDIGAVEFQVPSPRVNGVVVNGGAAQRSRVTSLQVTFSQIVGLGAFPAFAFQLVRQSDAASVSLLAAVNNAGPGTVVTLSFIGGAVNATSLADGRYTLTVLANSVSNINGQLDGNGDGAGGDNYQLVGAPNTAPNLFRLFGDADGDGDVDNTDFVQFRTAFGNGPSIFDTDGDGDTDNADFVAFRNRFGTTVP